MLKMNMQRRYLGECDGEWKWAESASISMTSVNSAAIGWTMRMAEMVFLVDVGRSKLAFSVAVNLSRVEIGQYLVFSRRGNAPTCRIANLNGRALRAIAKPKDSKVHTCLCRQRYAFDDGCRKNRDEQQCKCSEQQRRERCRRSQHLQICPIAVQKRRGWPASSRRGDEVVVSYDVKRVDDAIRKMGTRRLLDKECTKKKTSGNSLAT